jgi:sarcosine oxidase
MRHVDIAVIGAGVMGLATAYALRTSVKRVEVIEQFRVGHTRGSSHGNARIFKVSYPDAQFVKQAQASLAGWRELEALTGREILTLAGSIDTVDTGELAGRCDALASSGATYELLDSADVKRRFGMTLPADATALYQANGGVLHADRARAALLQALQTSGVVVAEEVKAQNLTLENGSVRIQTTAGSLTSSTVVVTAGAWVNQVISTLGTVLDVAPVRETVAYFRSGIVYPAPTLSEWRLRDREVAYGLVTRGGFLKVGVSGSGVPTEADADGRVDPAVILRASEWAARHLQLLDTTPVSAESCLYTNAPDERFIIERHGPIVIGSACSGHGFKFAPNVGEQLAALALESAAS